MLSTVSPSESLISIYPLLVSSISIENIASNTVKLANSDVVRKLAIENNVLGTLEDADFLRIRNQRTGLLVPPVTTFLFSCVEDGDGVVLGLRVVRLLVHVLQLRPPATRLKVR